MHKYIFTYIYIYMYMYLYTHMHITIYIYIAVRGVRRSGKQFTKIPEPGALFLMWQALHKL